MDNMFEGASAFSSQDLSRWDTSSLPPYAHDDFMTDSGGGNTEPNWKNLY
jgi:surface protein